MPLYKNTRESLLKKQILKTPHALSVTADETAQQILVIWTDRAIDETGYKLERSDDSGATWIDMAWLAANENSFVDRDVIRGSTYDYRVRAYKGALHSHYSNSANDTVYAVTDESNVELYLVAETGTKASGVEVTQGGAVIDEWEDQSGNVNDFNQGTQAEKPHYFGVVIDNNRSIVRFDGDDDHLKNTGNFLSSSDGLLLIAHKFTGLINTASQGQGILSSADEATDDYYWQARILVYLGGPTEYIEIVHDDNDTADAIRGDTGLAADTLYLDVWRSSGTAYTMRKNRSDESLFIRSGSNTGDWLGDTANRDNFTLGNMERTGRTHHYYGDLAQLILLSADPSDAVMNRIEKYLANEYWRRTETFMDEQYIETYTGVTWSVNKPTKFVGNPIFGDGTGGVETWDAEKNWVHVIKIDGQFRMWYSVLDDHGTQRNVCYATSEDGINWTKPTLGLITYDANTDNNIIMAAGEFNISLTYDPDATFPYVAVTETHSATNGAFIWTSTDGINWTFRQNIEVTACEAKGITRRPDGRYIVYTTVGHAGQDREINILLSDTDDPTGAWSEIGIEITSPDQDNQKYYANSLWYGENGINYLAVGHYNKTNETIITDLYSARSGYGTETNESAGWIPLGAGGTWDDSWTLTSARFVRVGNEWWIYYGGSPEKHDQATPRGTRIGLAKIGFERIGQVTDSGATGTITTDSFLPGAPLYVNCDASGGNELTAELLDTSDTPIANFAEADCDPITIDTFGEEITWGGNSILTDRELKIKFYLNGSTIYSYHV